MPLVDPIKLLKREDKWYLGNGGMLLYAPPFPKHLHIPGFWDECHFGDIAIEKLLCVSFVAEYSTTLGVGAVPCTSPSPASTGDKLYEGYVEGVIGDTLTMIRDGDADLFMGKLTDSESEINIDNLSSVTIVDLSGVSAFDSSRMAHLVVLIKQIMEARKELVFCNPNQQVKRLLETIRIDKYCKVFRTSREAENYAKERAGAGHSPYPEESLAGTLAPPREICRQDANAPMVELEAHTSHWHWYPDRIEIKHYLVERDGIGFKQQRGVRIFLNETRRIGADSTLHCDLSFEVLKGCEVNNLHVIAWTAHKNSKDCGVNNFTDLHGYGERLGYSLKASRREHKRGDKALKLDVTMGGNIAHTSLQVTPSHGAELTPRLKHTPLWDNLKHGKLSGEINGENVLGSAVYAGMHWKLPVVVDEIESLSLTVKTNNPADGSRPGAAHGHEGGYYQSLATPDPSEAWREFMALVPHFECSDPVLTRYYWYRWYGLRLNALPPGGNYDHPAVTEGISYFRGVITYSLMCHLSECKWLSDPSLALGCLRAHVKHQTKAGHFPGHIYLNHVNKRGFYHTDIGRSLAELAAHHPDAGIASEFVKPLQKLLRFYLTERDREGLDLFDLRDQFETGQEFSSRYFHGDDKADLHGWEHKLRLKGVDVTTYVYHLAVLLKDFGISTGDVKLVRECAELSERIKAAVGSFLWDSGQAMFVDYHARDKAKSPYLAAVGFWPLLSELATDEQALAAGLHLLPPSAGGTGLFDSPYPTPTVPRDDAYFSADPRWRGERANCPWNGRVWPMVNSHIADVLGRLCGLEPGLYRPQLAAYIQRYIAMMHFDSVGAAERQPKAGVAAAFPPPDAGCLSAAPTKDPCRPNCFEHYNPDDGTASEYRGIDDYQHSWVADLILKYVAGVRIENQSPIVDPMPFKLDWFLLKDCHVAGRKLDVCWNRNLKGKESTGFKVYVDGTLAHESSCLERLGLERQTE